MATAGMHDTLCQYNINLKSPIEIDDELFLVAENGDIFKYKDGQLKAEYHFGGQLSGMTIDKSKNIFLADLANQAVLARNNEEKEMNTPELVKEFEGVPLIGPNSLICSDINNQLYFTDSGPMGETSLENPKGSVFMIDLEAQIITPLALNCLAYPTGLALSQDEKVLYVSETSKNRVLRFVQTNQSPYYFSVFYQFSGRLGPTSIAVHQNDYIFVARYEFQHLARDGIISILHPSGSILKDIEVKYSPQITGLTFSKTKSNVLYVTEFNNSQSSCLRYNIKFDENEDDKDRINM